MSISKNINPRSVVAMAARRSGPGTQRWRCGNITPKSVRFTLIPRAFDSFGREKRASGARKKAAKTPLRNVSPKDMTLPAGGKSADLLPRFVSA